MSATPPFINASNFSGSSARAVRISLMLVGLGSRPAWVVRILPSLRFMISLLGILAHLTALSLPPAYPSHPMLRSAYGASKDDRGRGKCQKFQLIRIFGTDRSRNQIGTTAALRLPARAAQPVRMQSGAP